MKAEEKNRTASGSERVGVTRHGLNVAAHTRSLTLAILLTFAFVVSACAQSVTPPTPQAADEVVIDGSYANDVFGLGRTVSRGASRATWRPSAARSCNSPARTSAAT
jgi:hypothetical protein